MFAGVDEPFSLYANGNLSEVSGSFTDVLAPSNGPFPAQINVVAGTPLPSLNQLPTYGGHRTNIARDAKATTPNSLSGGGGGGNAYDLTWTDNSPLIVEVEGPPTFNITSYGNGPQHYSARIWSDTSDSNYYVTGISVYNRFPGSGSYVGFSRSGSHGLAPQLV